MKKRKALQFKTGKEASRGVFGLIISILCALVTIGIVILAIATKGGAGMVVAVAGLVVHFLALAGFIIALRALYKRNADLGPAIATLVINGLVIVFYLVVYFSGY